MGDPSRRVAGPPGGVAGFNFKIFARFGPSWCKIGVWDDEVCGFRALLALPGVTCQKDSRPSRCIVLGVSRVTKGLYVCFPARFGFRFLTFVLPGDQRFSPSRGQVRGTHEPGIVT